MTRENTSGLHRLPYGLLVVLLFTGWFQASAALRAGQSDPELARQISLPVTVQVAAGGVWAVVMVVTAALIWRRVPGWQRAGRWIFGAWCIYSLLRLFLFVRSDYDHARLPFLTALSVGALALMMARAIVRRHWNGEERT